MDAKKKRRRPPPRRRTGNRIPTIHKDRPDEAIVKRPQDELAPLTSEALSPRQRLQAVAKGKAPLRHEDIESLLADLVIDSDRRSRSLSRRCAGLVDMVFDAESRKTADPGAAMDLMMKLDRVQRSHLADARRGIELLSKITRPQRPTVQVVASSSQLNVAAAQQVAGRVDLGEADESC